MMWKKFLALSVLCLVLLLPSFSQEVVLTEAEWEAFKKESTELEKIFLELEKDSKSQKSMIEKLEKDLESSIELKENSIAQLKEAEVYLALSQTELEKLKSETRKTNLKVGGISALLGILAGGIATLFLVQ